MFKPNRVFKKKEIHKKRPTENNIQEREQKRKMFKDTRIKQRKIEKKKNDKHAKTNKYEKVHNKKGNEQTSFFFWCGEVCEQKKTLRSNPCM